MRIPGPYSDDTWDVLQRSQTATETSQNNGVARVVWELGLVLMVPLAGAGVVELVLKALSIY